MSSTTVGVVVSVLLLVHVAVMATFGFLWVRRRGRCVLSARGGRSERELDLALVTVLKPLAGYDEDLDDNLASFASQDGVPYEIVFGCASRLDPAFEAAQRFIARHPHVSARVVVTDAEAALNRKVAQLCGMARAARGDVLVVSDSNVFVGPHYLRDLVAPLRDEACGLVTSLIAGTGERSIGAALENLQLSGYVAPCVVLSTVGVPVTIGKSMAMRRADLDALGGFERFGCVLAEDHALGRAFVDAGFAIATSFAPIENRHRRVSILTSFDRHVRWAKLRRVTVPSVFAIELLFTPIVVAALGVVAAPSALTVGLFAVAVVLQTTTSHLAAWAVRGHPLALRYLPIELLRTVVLFAVWSSACLSRTVTWRGHTFTLGRGSVIAPVAAESTEAETTA